MNSTKTVKATKPAPKLKDLTPRKNAKGGLAIRVGSEASIKGGKGHISGTGGNGRV